MQCRDCLEIIIEECELLVSERGVSYELVRKIGMQNDIKEIMIITTKPGTSRGNHYHKKKNEWLGVISGNARFVFVDNRTGERKDIEVSGSKPTMVHIPTEVTHTIINTGSTDIAILEISDHIYSEDDTDTFPNKIV